MSIMNVFVASKSEQKTGPVARAFEKHFSDRLTNVLWYSVSSNINEQPVWHEETRQWAYNRLQALKQKNTIPDYYISVENGILPLWNNWYDFGHIIIETKDGTIKEILTQSVQFPTDAVEEAKRRWFKDVTVWKVMQEMYPKLNHADPHYSLTNWIYTRKQLIYNALLGGLGELTPSK